jgi:hypothetical protein
MANQAPINVGPGDTAMTISIPLPAANASVVTGILDLGTSAPNSSAWRLGRFHIICPALAENTTGAGITVTMAVAGPSLTNSPVAPQPAVPGTFAAPTTSQITTIPAVAAGGSLAFSAWQTAAFDSTGSTQQFYQWTVAVPAGVATQGEALQIVWEYNAV